MPLFDFFNKTKKRDELLAQIAQQIFDLDAEGALSSVETLVKKHGKDPQIEQPLREAVTVLGDLDPAKTLDKIIWAYVGSRPLLQRVFQNQTVQKTRLSLLEHGLSIAEKLAVSENGKESSLALSFLNGQAHHGDSSSLQTMAAKALMRLSLLEHEKGHLEKAFDHLVHAAPRIVPSPIGYFDTICLDLWTERNTKDELAFYGRQFSTESLANSGLFTRLAENFMKLYQPEDIEPQNRYAYIDVLSRIYRGYKPAEGDFLQNIAIADKQNPILAAFKSLARIAEERDGNILGALSVQERMIRLLSESDASLSSEIESFKNTLQRYAAETDPKTFYKKSLYLSRLDFKNAISHVLLDAAENRIASEDDEVINSCTEEALDLFRLQGSDFHPELAVKHTLFLCDKAPNPYKQFSNLESLSRTLIDGGKELYLRPVLQRWAELAESETPNDPDAITHKSRVMSQILSSLKKDNCSGQNTKQRLQVWHDLADVPLEIARRAAGHFKPEGQIPLLRWIINEAPEKSATLIIAAASYTQIHKSIMSENPELAQELFPLSNLIHRKGPPDFRRYFNRVAAAHCTQCYKGIGEISKRREYLPPQQPPALSPDDFVKKLGEIRPDK